MVSALIAQRVVGDRLAVAGIPHIAAEFRVFACWLWRFCGEALAAMRGGFVGCVSCGAAVAGWRVSLFEALEIFVCEVHWFGWVQVFGA